MPGEYKVRLTIGDDVQEQDFRIRVDPEWMVIKHSKLVDNGGPVTSSFAGVHKTPSLVISVVPVRDVGRFVMSAQAKFVS